MEAITLASVPLWRETLAFMAFVDLEHAKRIRELNKKDDDKRKAVSERKKVRREAEMTARNAKNVVKLSKKPRAKPKAKPVEVKKHDPWLKYRPGMGNEFYSTFAWRQLRWDVLRHSNGRCAMCNASKESGVVIHVDHIKPRSKYPGLELVKENLQILCEDCNIGKSNS